MKSGILLLLVTLGNFIATSQTCADSSFRLRYVSTSKFFIREHINTSDNGSILIGGIGGSSGNTANGLILKADAGGNVQWSRKMLLSNDAYLNKVIELSNGEIVVAGHLLVNGSGAREVVLLKLASGGFPLWGKACNLNAAFSEGDEKRFYAIAGGQNGDIVIAWQSTHTEANKDSSHAVISRLNAAGKIIWSKAFVSNDDVFTDPAGIFVQNNTVVSLGHVSDMATTCFTGIDAFYGMKLDYATGALLQLKSYCYSEGMSGATSGIAHDYQFSTTRLSQNRFALYGGFARYTPQNSYYYKVIFDDQLNLLKSKIYTTPRSVGVHHRRAYLTPNGNMHISLSNFSTQKTYWATLDSNDQAKHQKAMPFPASGITPGSVGSFGYKAGNTTYAFSYSLPTKSFVQFFQIQDDNQGADPCLGTDTAFISTETFTDISQSDWYWKQVIENPIVRRPYSFSVSDAAIQKEDICKQVSRCNNLRTSGPDTVCVLGQEVTYTVLKNSECNKRIIWQSDPDAAHIITPVNESTIRVRFQMPGTGALQTQLYASAGDCSVAKDTVAVTLLPIAQSLPDDTVLCTGQTLRLSPGNWFKSYLWQDGSTDSVFIATKPGVYYVRVQAYCGYALSDTIYITEPKLTLGPNKIKCSSDTVRLQAPAGFSEYIWSPVTDLMPISDSVANVFPAMSRAYAITAKIAAGCIVKDTVFVNVLSTPVVYVGNDTTVCEGAPLTLQPNTAFSKYQWSNGSTASTITVTVPGLYWLETIDKKGCRNSDSIFIQQRECVQKIFFPTAFTPNSDGKNDVFKPYVEGAVAQYELIVYNRWGNIVFKTVDTTKGWNGTLNGTLQDTGAFVWLCRYTFRNKRLQMQKGNVLLIR